jgi:peptide/nickel transport system ATP-binding protein
LLIADEPTTALDVTVQAQILSLLDRLKREFGSSLIVITHDMGVVAELADRVMVMYAGRLVETGRKSDVLSGPLHPYTRGLLAAIPPMEGMKPRRLTAIPGAPPSPPSMPSGCAFSPRCVERFAPCSMVPDLVGKQHGVACHHVVQPA